ncbi:hypothetical protein CIB84_009978 [Bambusicola thoracicus]|uniref:Uncharacterized protein n=1 Tax=Bambusicola thoracicus TaxID=9083 RepID=A0A2P4SQ90_BAMTH|nr:hypothetical protein CIB84_009978 [Bambusicola thoracicus]
MENEQQGLPFLAAACRLTVQATVVYLEAEHACECIWPRTALLFCLWREFLSQHSCCATQPRKLTAPQEFGCLKSSKHR